MPATVPVGQGRATRIAAPGALFTTFRPPSFVLFDERDEEIHLRERGAYGAALAHVYVATGDADQLRAYLRRHLHQVALDEDIAVEDRAWALHRALLDEITEVHQAIRRRPSLHAMTAALRELAQFLAVRRDSFPFLSMIVGSDYTLVTHGVETALYAVAVAVSDGKRDIDGLTALGLGGLLADLGKLDLPDVGRHGGALDEGEWKQMRRHPLRSAEMMRQASGVVPALAMRGVLGHHERWGGSGYPSRLAGDAIPYEARVIAIADAFSAMTVNRAHQQRVDPFEALTEMAGTLGQFDPTLLRRFVLMLGAANESAR